MDDVIDFREVKTDLIVTLIHRSTLHQDPESSEQFENYDFSFKHYLKLCYVTHC